MSELASQSLENKATRNTRTLRTRLTSLLVVAAFFALALFVMGESVH